MKGLTHGIVTLTVCVKTPSHQIVKRIPGLKFRVVRMVRGSGRVVRGSGRGGDSVKKRTFGLFVTLFCVL